ncbi:ubiquitin carboxyl-terminal hydrolase 26 [Camelus ferus]|uniref:Ubiquitin carboxyl-terminal hydrolase n=2 Tax=Camelus TaxID=9836 RepID=A0A8B6YQJ2_CAMFR|nr:ubiquitin carboxyl-terminal hydrolase 26 [Camelus ferus]XP_010966751.1 ubiquitin carboxyl-terminal hydrolase 26 [Camelus bactrianus]
MTALMVRGFVQIWNKKTGMSKSKEAFIETVEGKKKVKLVVYFIGECKTFQLSNNIKNMIFRSYGKKQNHLHLTFQNNSFLFIEKLSSRDAENLKMFLERIHQNNLQTPIRPDNDKSVFASTTIQKSVNKTSFNKMYKKSSSRSLEKGKRNGTPDLKEMPLFTSTSSTFIYKELLKNGYGKRKRVLSTDSEMIKNFLKEIISLRKKISKTNPLRYVSRSEKKELRLKVLKQNKKFKVGSSFKIRSTGNPYLDGANLLQRLSEKLYLAFLSEPNFGEDDPEWDKFKMTFHLYPEKLWQGLPNLGNTCYMNAVLQSIFSIPSFADDFLSQGFPWGKIPLDALSMYLVQLFVLKDIYNIKVKEKLLVSIKKAISAVAEIFSDNTQNDAHEFLGHCLDQMKENMRKFNIIWKTKIESKQRNSPQQVSAGSAATKVVICPITTNFEFELLRSIICKACGQVVLKTEVSNYLSISLPQGVKTPPSSIQSSFDLFFEAEELEYECEKCMHRDSVAVHKFSRLPRVLIVHLKRYSFNEFWSFRKDDQEVVISKYLKLSSHCDESTKPPCPLSNNAHIRDFQLLKIFQEMNSKTISSSTRSKKLTSKSKDSLPPHIGSYKECKPQKCHIRHKGSSGECLGKYSDLNIIESALINSGDVAIIAKELLADLLMDLEDNSHSLKGEPTSSPDTSQEVHRNPKRKKYKRTNMFVDFEGIIKTTEDFCKDKKPRSLSERFHKVAEQTYQYEKMRVYEQALWMALLRSLPKPLAQRYTENLRRTTELSFQETNVNSPRALGSRKTRRNKDCLDTKKTGPEAKKPKRNAKMGDRNAYRLIGVVSHLGKTPDGGHYISDTYDFERQVWFTYNDLQVSNIQEEAMQEARLRTGYMFFYMHNEIFEELLGREDNSQPQSKEARETPQE